MLYTLCFALPSAKRRHRGAGCSDSGPRRAGDRQRRRRRSELPDRHEGEALERQLGTPVRRELVRALTAVMDLSPAFPVLCITLGSRAIDLLGSRVLGFWYAAAADGCSPLEI